ncbi:MAG: protease inhibitor I42 family protein [Gammaproteobacteria bacterium]
MPRLQRPKFGPCFALSAAALLVGCGQPGEPGEQPAATPPTTEPPAVTTEMQQRPEQPRAAPTLVLTEADEGRAVTLQIDQVVEIRLPSDRISGLTWVPAQNTLPVLATDGLPRYEPPEAPGTAAVGVEIWRFKARQPGHAHLAFEYRRPTVPTASPERTIMYHFDVE